MPSARTPTAVIHRLLALGLAAIFALALGELAVRALAPRPKLVIEPPGFYTADPPGRYRLTPGYRGRITNRVEYDNEIRMTSAGLRGPQPAPAAGGERLRILAIGDSFTFGVGVEADETFVARLAARLETAGRSVEGLNAGIPAFGVPDAELWLRRHGLALEPDVVILGIFLGNDLIDASPDREPIEVVDGLLVPARSPRGLRAWLFRHSQLYGALKGLTESPAFAPLRSRLGLGEPWTQRVLREELTVYRRDAPTRLAPAIEATDRALGRLADETLAAEMTLLALLIPSELQVDPERWVEAMAALDLDPADYDLDTPTRIFRSLLEGHSIATVEPSPALARRIAEGDTLYYRYDRHWTAAGHRVAARALEDELERRLPPG